MRLRRRASHGTPGATTVHSMGGLGNQLFIYAAGTAAAKISGTRLRIDVGQHAARPDRPFLLGDLGFAGEVVDVTAPKTALARRVGNAVPDACGYREPAMRYDPAALEQGDGACLYGYFQAWRYVDPVAEELRGHFARLLEARTGRLRPALTLLADPTTVVLHVRRGDYLAPGAAEFHGLARGGFYASAVRVLRRMGFSGKVFVLSDDVPAALQELGADLDVRALGDPAFTAVDEMLLMSAAPALVTANSSFSWWAAWIGDAPERPVIAPRPWFDATEGDGRDLLLPHWLTLDRRSG